MGQITISAWDKDITIDFPDDMEGQAPAAFVLKYDYEEMILDDDDNEIPNPQDEVEFTVVRILEYIKDVIRESGIRVARDAASDAARLDIEAKLNQIDLTIDDV
jgi:hypothetical protein